MNTPRIDLSEWRCLNCGGRMTPVTDPRLGDCAGCTECGTTEPL